MHKNILSLPLLALLSAATAGTLSACNANSQANCSTDSDCGAGETCDPVNKWCQKPLPPGTKTGCFTNKDCGVGQVCGQALVCVDDTVCSSDGTWCRKDPLPGGQTFYDPLYGVWAASATQVWAVGDGADVLHFDGTAWSAQSPGISHGLLQGVWGTDASNVYVVGNNGTILHYDGSSWTQQSTGTQAYLTAVWGSGTKDIYAVGGSGANNTVILHSGDGQSWQSVSPPAGHTGYLHGVWGAAAGHIVLVGEQTVNGFGPILMGDGTTFQDAGIVVSQNPVNYAHDYLRSVYGTAVNDVWAVGEGGVMYHYDGANWARAQSGTTATLYGVNGSGPGNVLAVGALGTVLKLGTQGQWIPVTGPTQSAFFGVWTGDLTSGWTVGYNGTAMRRIK